MDKHLKSKLPILPSLLHIIFTAIFLFILYLMFGPAKSVELEMVNEILWLIIIPFILIGVTILFCTIVGLPIRTIQKIHVWWTSKQAISFIGIVVGFFLLWLTTQDSFIDTEILVQNEQEILKETPNQILLISGWLLAAFCMLHFYPKHFYENIKRKFTSSSLQS